MQARVVPRERFRKPPRTFGFAEGDCDPVSQGRKRRFPLPAGASRITSSSCPKRSSAE
jgi:hypothetical protein